jgi:tripartite-type tricarboxylate transporter receptor subunit TctC
VLGVVNEKRVSALPEVPTIGETIKGFGSTLWYGLLALDTPDAREKLAAVGCEPYKSTPEQFAAQIKDELPKWARIVKESGATVD